MYHGTTWYNWYKVDALEVIIDINDPEPPFAQLMTQIKQAVQTGAVKPGDPLPSIRQLANDLDLNNKTVAKAYRLLERDSVIESRGYRGTFVHADAAKNSEVDLGEWVTEELAKLVSRFRNAGMTDPEIRNAFANVMNDRTR